MQVTNKRERLRQLVEALPPELLDTAERLLERLAFRETPSKAVTVRLGNLWREANLNLSEADITQLRREIWSVLGEGQP
jgi:hypothetical protein